MFLRAAFFSLNIIADFFKFIDHFYSCRLPAIALHGYPIALVTFLSTVRSISFSMHVLNVVEKALRRNVTEQLCQIANSYRARLHVEEPLPTHHVDRILGGHRGGWGAGGRW